MDKLQAMLRIAPEVQHALDNNRPLVALGSTDLAFAIPYPQNVQAARQLQESVRAGGAVPAMMAVLDGKLCIGLEDSALDALCRQGPALAKASRRDLPVLAAQGGSGATTVAATMVLAALVSARVFATGGIGGVYSGSPLDVSADLEELGRTSTLVVCSGIQPAQDIPSTLEVLETRGVPVLGHQTGHLPPFFTRGTAHPLDTTTQTPLEAARVFAARSNLGLRGGVLVVNPIPEDAALTPDMLDNAVHSAMAEARQSGAAGKALATFLAGRLAQTTGGKTSNATIRLLLENTRLAADIAVELAAIL